MAARFINIDRHTPMLLPPDMRAWIGEDDLAHFVIEAVERLPLSAFAGNRKTLAPARKSTGARTAGSPFRTSAHATLDSECMSPICPRRNFRRKHGSLLLSTGRSQTDGKGKIFFARVISGKTCEGEPAQS
ncbi:MAG: hypothetical protein ABJF10_25700 [Chthoniobacter sp.]|uniref:hypothetical protein n=1 Tax=Chthoniobacter sp. TaxID=2510640 RepID=UPI0032A1C242